MSAVADTTKQPAVTSLDTLRQPKDTGGPLVVAGFGDSSSFALLQRIANALSQSDLIPVAYRGNLPNCIIALELAGRIGASPLMVMQNLYIVHGKPAWSSQFLIAAVNQCGRYTSLQYEWSGEEGKDSWTCRAFATDKRTGARVQGPAVSVKMAKDQGWWNRKDSKWPSMTELMMVYRAATYFARTNAPELTMGLSTVDEAHDVIEAIQTQPGHYEATTESLRQPAPAVETEKPTKAKREKPPEPAPQQNPEVQRQEPQVTLAVVLGYIENAKSSETAEQALDLARTLAPAERAEATAAFNKKWATTLGDDK